MTVLDKPRSVPWPPSWLASTTSKWDVARLRFVEYVKILPLDNYESSTVSLDAWIAGEGDPEVTTRIREYAQACYVLGRIEGAPAFPELCEPKVAFNPASDSHFFIFKASKGGYTFLVGQGVYSLIVDDRRIGGGA